MNLTSAYVAQLHEKIKARRPIIHCITNVVTVNDCANILLAAGASPTMAHHPQEVAEITGGADALVCNLGATDDYKAMEIAGRQAHLLGHPIVIDPVGVSGSTFRRETLLTWMEDMHPTCVRGNYSEIRAMIDNCRTVTGVDVAEGEHTEEVRKRLMREMQQYALEHRTILIASGETDILTDGQGIWLCANGDAQMARITGSGCMSSALLGAFLSGEPSLESAAACCAFLGIAGELAAQQTLAQGGGTMTFHDRMIDAVSLMNEEELRRIRLEKQI